MIEFLIWLLCAFATMGVATAKNRNVVGWFFIGLVLPVIALIVVSVMPALADPDKMKKCPECAETVLKDAKVCKHCGHRFERITNPSQPE